MVLRKPRREVAHVFSMLHCRGAILTLGYDSDVGDAISISESRKSEVLAAGLESLDADVKTQLTTTAAEKLVHELCTFYT
jgi:hypothetical protein